MQSFTEDKDFSCKIKFLHGSKKTVCVVKNIGETHSTSLIEPFHKLIQWIQIPQASGSFVPSLYQRHGTICCHLIDYVVWVQKSFYLLTNSCYKYSWSNLKIY